MSYKLVIAEKLSVAQSIAKVIGADRRGDGYLEGNGYLVSWCVGHLVELAPPESYDEKYEKWRYSDLPILPSEWKYQISDATIKQFSILKKLMEREDVTGLVEAIDAGREGELIFRLVYHQAKCKKPFERLWICYSTEITCEGSIWQKDDTKCENIRCKAVSYKIETGRWEKLQFHSYHPGSAATSFSDDGG